MKKIALDYKGKHFILADENQGEDEVLNEYVDCEKIINSDKLLEEYIEDCIYYGIPTYLGEDKKLKKRIKKIENDLSKHQGG